MSRAPGILSGITIPDGSAVASTPRVEVRHGDGTVGAPDRAPLDAISIAAMAQNRVPPALWAQLAEHGVLVAPVGRDRRGELERHHRVRVDGLSPVGFVPLVEE